MDDGKSHDCLSVTGVKVRGNKRGIFSKSMIRSQFVEGTLICTHTQSPPCLAEFQICEYRSPCRSR